MSRDKFGGTHLNVVFLKNYGCQIVLIEENSSKQKLTWEAIDYISEAPRPPLLTF